MGFFTETRMHIGNSILAKKASRHSRKPYYRNFGDVKTIGIVWDASRSEEFASLSKFYQQMHDRNIEVFIIGYYQGKELPNQYTAIRYLTCLREKEVNFFYLPLTPEADKFINTRYNILIDVNFNRIFPLTWMTVLSKAGFKVGLTDHVNHNDPFDLMIELKRPVKIDEYLTHVIHYLEMINADATVKVETI